ncbi:hypothetical protein JW911_00595 [Candidatus Peregrinibacteria bacterium]|nr:hypothetical protein [Candidatus Peregrinibacteria bacterium]
MEITLIFLIIFFILAVFISITVFILATKHKVTERHKRFVRKEWAKIIQIKDLNPNAALMEADKLFDHLLTLLGYTGGLGDKLKKCGSLFHDLNGLWLAHKTRNKIAHEIGFKLNVKECDSLLKKFKHAFHDLGVTFK